MTTLRTRDKVSDTAAAFRLLADQTRCRILLLLNKKKEGLCVYEIAEALGMTHSATSHQLGSLERGGILESFREGQTICYSIAKTPHAQTFVRVLRSMHR